MDVGGSEALPQREQRSRRRTSNISIGEQSTTASLSQNGKKRKQKEDFSSLFGSRVQVPAPTPDPASDLFVQEYRSGRVGNYNFEYLDHTADVQLHAWGPNLERAFEQVALAMFNYMTPLEDKVIDESLTRDIEVEGHDMHSLLYAYLDELLFIFATELMVCCDVKINEFDRAGWRIKATVKGEKFDRQRHACGTEVKAITYSAMQVIDKPGDAEVFVIIDI